MKLDDIVSQYETLYYVWHDDVTIGILTSFRLTSTASSVCPDATKCGIDSRRTTIYFIFLVPL
jgi:hypothetical protein